MSMKMKVMYACSQIFKVTQQIPVVARFVDVFTAFMVTVLRGGSGVWVAQNLDKCKRPEKMLRLYEFEGCPFCRKVRETFSVLDLDAEIRPCPRTTLRVYGSCENSRFRQEVKDLGGELMFPFLVDDNTGKRMNDSTAINKYLWETYGAKATPPLTYKLGDVLTKTPFFLIPNILRPSTVHGVLRVPSRTPKQPLELWGCEASPFVRLVREALSVLELPYTLHNVAHGSERKRLEFREKYASKLSMARKISSSTTVQMPFLLDPNTGSELLESADIVKYLYSTYQDGNMPEETWLDFQTKKDE